MRQAARFSAAHSTLILQDLSSSRIAGTSGPDELLEGCVLSGPRNVPVERRDDEDSCEVVASHDGYARAFGLLHQRTLRVARNGERIEGSIVSCPRAGKHGAPDRLCDPLSPSSTGQGRDCREWSGRAVVTPNGQQWAFHASGFPVNIEDSAFFASPEGTRATSQIVLSGKARAGDGIDWVFLKKD